MRLVRFFDSTIQRQEFPSGKVRFEKNAFEIGTRPDLEKTL